MTIKNMKTIDDIVEYCKSRPEAQFVIIPFNDNGEFNRLEVLNPFYTTEKRKDWLKSMGFKHDPSGEVL